MKPLEASLCYTTNTAHSWRSVKQGLLLDGFYDPQNSEAFAFVKNWTNGNADGAKPGGIYSNKDIRFLGSHFIYIYIYIN